jgi:hypothetical protein
MDADTIGGIIPGGQEEAVFNKDAFGNSKIHHGGDE